MSGTSAHQLVGSRVSSGRSGTWTALRPVLPTGDLGFETDTGKFKVGDGVTAWPSLPYADPDGPESGEIPEIDGGTP